MIRITRADFDKFVNFLKKEGQDGAVLSFSCDSSHLVISTVDRKNVDMKIEISDVEYPRTTRVTKTDTF